MKSNIEQVFDILDNKLTVDLFSGEQQAILTRARLEFTLMKNSMQKFVNRVERGEVRSVHTYGEMKLILKGLGKEA